MASLFLTLGEESLSKTSFSFSCLLLCCIPHVIPVLDETLCWFGRSVSPGHLPNRMRGKSIPRFWSRRILVKLTACLTAYSSP